MPLDYQLWKVIVDKVMETAPDIGTDSKAAFTARLRTVAKTLPRGTLAGAIRRMKEQIEGVIAAKGYHPKSD